MSLPALARFDAQNPAHAAGNNPYGLVPNEATAKGVAKWWREQIDGRKIAGRDNGTAGKDEKTHGPCATPFAQGLFALNALNATADARALGTDKFDAFEADLAALIMSGALYSRDLSVDYAPSATLRDLAREHGIKANAFPWKTHTWVYGVYAEASLGYGAAAQVIAGVKPAEIESPIDNLPTHACAGISTRSYDGVTWITSTPFKDGKTTEWEKNGRAITFASAGEADARATHERVVSLALQAVEGLAVPRPWMTNDEYAELQQKHTKRDVVDVDAVRKEFDAYAEARRAEEEAFEGASSERFRALLAADDSLCLAAAADLDDASKSAIAALPRH